MINEYGQSLYRYLEKHHEKTLELTDKMMSSMDKGEVDSIKKFQQELS